EGVARMVSHKLFIPPYPAGSTGSESLNVATAAAIVCSEFRRPADRPEAGLKQITNQKLI
ncbi:MAG: hypothetical protein LBU97_05100, partial [Alistipes sp.]|nr:hypothetical protein [Alistipes sp.]